MKTAEIAPPVSFVYFDVGGVLIKDFSESAKGLDMLQELGIDVAEVPKFRRLWNKYAEPRVCIDYDADDFHQIIEQAFGVQIPEHYSLMEHGFVDRFEPNPSIRPALTRLIGKVNMGLLTNMYPRMLRAIQAKEGLMPMVLWNVVVDSSEVGMKKPETAIFAHATELTGKPKEQILFVDNTQGNLDAAAAYGWQTYWYDSADYAQSSERLEKFFRHLKS